MNIQINYIWDHTMQSIKVDFIEKINTNEIFLNCLITVRNYLKYKGGEKWISTCLPL